MGKEDAIHVRIISHMTHTEVPTQCNKLHFPSVFISIANVQCTCVYLQQQIIEHYHRKLPLFPANKLQDHTHNHYSDFAKNSATHVVTKAMSTHKLTPKN